MLMCSTHTQNIQRGGIICRAVCAPAFVYVRDKITDKGKREFFTDAHMR